MNGAVSIPAISPITIAATPATSSAACDWVSCRWAVDPRSLSELARVTIIPVETAISSAGICVASPSPTVSSA